MTWRRVVALGAVLAAAVGAVVVVFGGGGVETGSFGVVSERTLPRPAEVVWSSVGEDSGSSHVFAVHAGRDVVVVGSGGGYHGFDVRSGDLMWRIPLEVAGQTAVVGGGHVVGALDGSVVAFDVRSGARWWTWRADGAGAGGAGADGGTGDPALEPALVAAGKVFVVVGRDVLVALDAATGTPSWEADVRVGLDASMSGIVGEERGVLHLWVSRPAGAVGAAVSSHVVAVDAVTGEVGWERDAPLGALVDGGRLLLPQPDREVHVVDAVSGELVGSVGLPLSPPARPEPGSIGRPASAEVVPWMHVRDDVLLATVEGRMAAVALGSGETLWTSELPGEAGRVITSDATSVYVATASALVAVGRDDGAVREVERRDDGVVGRWSGGPDGIIVDIDPRAAAVTSWSGGQVGWTSTVVTPTPVGPRPAGSLGVAVHDHARVQLLDADDGELQWESTAGQRGPPVLPVAVRDDRVFVLRAAPGPDRAGSGAGELVALESATGESIWRAELADGLIVTSDLVAAGDSVVVGAADGIWVHSADNGRLRFVVSTGARRIRSAGAVTDVVGAGDAVAFVVGPGPRGRPTAGPADASQRLRGDERLVAVTDVASGDVRWQRRLSVCGRISMTGRVVLVPTASGVSALDLADGDVRWTVDRSRPSCWAPVAVGDVVAVAGDTSSVTGLDATTGAHAWTTQLDRPVSAQPVIAGDGLLVPTGDRLVELDLDDGDVRWEVRAPHRIDAPPTVVDGTVVIASAAGHRSALR